MRGISGGNKKVKGLYAKRNHFIGLILVYFILIGLGFIYIYPMLYMIVNSLMSQNDLVDPSVSWVPSEICWDNYMKAFKTLDFFRSFSNSLISSVPTAILQTAVTACIGFGLARFDFPFKKMWIVLVLLTFLIPGYVTLVPRYVLFYQYHMLNTVWPAYLPALLGQGMKSTIFIFLFYMVFNSYPKAFDEAAQIDGAGKFKIFYRIALPMGKSTVFLSLLFSLIWYWNETEQTNMYFGSVMTTLPLQLQSFSVHYTSLYGDNDVFQRLNESVSMAGTLLSILPVILLYLCCQKQFTKSVERTGITGE